MQYLGIEPRESPVFRLPSGDLNPEPTGGDCRFQTDLEGRV